MRVPKRRKAIIAAQVSSMQSYPAPVGGLNARDSLAAMKPTDAVALDNWFPSTSYLQIRGGYAQWATGMTGNGKTLAVYNAQTGSSNNKLFCSTASGVYDVSSAGAVGASVAARTNGKHQWLNFGDGTSDYLIMVNGVDKPLYFDGAAWVAVDGVSVPALTGLTTTKIIHVNSFKNRLFFVEKDSLSFWYLAAGAAGGALTEFPLDGFAKKGGYLMAMATWTIDAGDGPDDRAVFITSEGEVLIYQGNNPSSATAWGLVGVYDFGRPLGRKCFAKYNGDLVLLTQNGVFPMAKAVQSTVTDYRLALSDKINKLFSESALNYGSVFGWTIVVHPTQQALIVNVPQAEDGTHIQYAMNTITQSWCTFSAWNAEDFVVFNNELYYTSGTRTVKAWTGSVDGTDAIIAYGKTAFSYFGQNTQTKQFKMFRPILATNGSVTFLTDIDVDFQDAQMYGVATYNVTGGAIFDSSKWDESYWASSLEVRKEWTSPSRFLGTCASGKIKITTNSLTIQWMANDFLYETGGVIG